MMSLTITFDGGHVKVRSNKVKFRDQYFAYKAHGSDSELSAAMSLNSP